MGHLFDLTLLDLSGATGQAISESFQHYMKDLCTQSLYIKYCGQTMTEAEHNRPIPKLFDNRPLALATKVFCETIGLVIYIQNIPIIVSFSLLLS